MAPGLRRRCSSRAPRSALIPPPASTPVPARRVSRPALQMRKLRFQDAKSLSGIQVKIKLMVFPERSKPARRQGWPWRQRRAWARDAAPVPCRPGPQHLGTLGLRQGPRRQGEGAERQRPEHGQQGQRRPACGRLHRGSSQAAEEPGVRPRSLGAQAHLHPSATVSPDPTAPPSPGHRKCRPSPGPKHPRTNALCLQPAQKGRVDTAASCGPRPARHRA